MNLLHDAGLTACFTEHSTCTPKYWGEAEVAIGQRANQARTIEVMNIQTDETRGIGRIVFPDGVGYISGFPGGTTVKEVSQVLDEMEAQLQAPPQEYITSDGYPVY